MPFIRPFQPEDLDSVMEIWLQGNLDAHPFIPADDWRQQLPHVRSLIPAAKLLVCEEQECLLGFLGLEGAYIAGIFVRRQDRSRGIGRALLDAAKRSHPSLRLHVYQQNTRALAFYQREGFVVVDEQANPQNAVPELLLEWRKK